MARRLRKRNQPPAAASAENGGGVAPQLGRREIGHEVVDGVLRHPRRRQLKRGGRHDAQEALDVCAPVGNEMLEKPASRGHLVQLYRGALNAT